MIHIHTELLLRFLQTQHSTGRNCTFVKYFRDWQNKTDNNTNICKLHYLNNDTELEALTVTTCPHWKSVDTNEPWRYIVETSASITSASGLARCNLHLWPTTLKTEKSPIFIRKMATLRFVTPFGGLEATYANHIRLTGKLLVDFLLVISELFFR